MRQLEHRKSSSLLNDACLAAHLLVILADKQAPHLPKLLLLPSYPRSTTFHISILTEELPHTEAASAEPWLLAQHHSSSGDEADESSHRVGGWGQQLWTSLGNS